MTTPDTPSVPEFPGVLRRILGWPQDEAEDELQDDGAGRTGHVKVQETTA